MAHQEGSSPVYPAPYLLSPGDQDTPGLLIQRPAVHEGLQVGEPTADRGVVLCSGMDAGECCRLLLNISTRHAVSCYMLLCFSLFWWFYGK